MRLTVLIISLTLSACGLFDRKPPAPTSAVPTRQVPYEARDNYFGLRKRIIILPFVDEKVSRSVEVKKVARATVVRSLDNTNKFVIVRNSDFPKELSKYLNANNEYDLEKIAAVANGMGIAAVVEGKILEVKARRISDDVGVFRKVKARISTTVRVRVVSAKNGRKILEDVRTGVVDAETTRVAERSFSDRYLEEDPVLIRKSVGKAFSQTLGNVVKSIEKLSWEGRVALISGERVFVNAGRLSGIQIGDILKITEVGEEVYDPDTGAFIGRAPGRMKGTIEVVSYFGRDGAIGLVHSGSGFQENDHVQLY